MKLPVRTIMMLWRHALNSAALGAGFRCVSCGVQDRPDNDVLLWLYPCALGHLWFCGPCREVVPADAECFECRRRVALVDLTVRASDGASLCPPCARRELK